MRLKRIYNHDAPKKEWSEAIEQCNECEGKGVVINEALDGVETCRTCEGNKTVTKLIPPVQGVIVEQFGDKQKFTPRLVDRGIRQGWIKMEGLTLTITGENTILLYNIKRVPGRYDDETIQYYDCELIAEKEVSNG